MLRLPVQIKAAKGYALVEILLAFGLSTVVVLAMVSLAVSTIRAGTTNRAYAEAGKMAQSQAERLKLLHDTTAWPQFLASMTACTSGHPCYIDRDLTIYTGTNSISMGYFSITYFFTTTAAATAQEFTYRVETSWAIADVPKTYRIEGLVSNWRAP
jgi:Tfp pilus assembly protein PilV